MTLLIPAAPLINEGRFFSSSFFLLSLIPYDNLASPTQPHRSPAAHLWKIIRGLCSGDGDGDGGGSW